MSEMEKEVVVVNDTNIFIDLMSVDLLDHFFRLPIAIHTNDFVISELNDETQKRKVLSFHPTCLYIKSYSATEVEEIVAFHSASTHNISFTDCSVWLYAKQNSFRLLTGDKRLRTSAIDSETAVSGILYIFDMLVEKGIVSPETGYMRLTQLAEINHRLPSDEIKKRISKWRK